MDWIPPIFGNLLSGPLLIDISKLSTFKMKTAAVALVTAYLAAQTELAVAASGLVTVSMQQLSPVRRTYFGFGTRAPTTYFFRGATARRAAISTNSTPPNRPHFLLSRVCSPNWSLAQPATQSHSPHLKPSAASSWPTLSRRLA